MNRGERKRLVDSVLDRALGPQMVEPRPGLEERILANLQSQPQPRPWWRWMWVPAVAATALLAVVIGMRLMHQEVSSPIQSKKTIEQPKPEVAVKPETPVGPSARPPNVARHTVPRVTPQPAMAAAKAEPLPRMGVFPAPVPMTEQERLLLAFVRRQPEQAKVIADEQRAEHERLQKYFDAGDVSALPAPAQDMR